jgi:hypothetical protein
LAVGSLKIFYGKNPIFAMYKLLNILIEFCKPTMEKFLFYFDKATFPQFQKIQILKYYSDPNTIWIETGTYRGTTTLNLAKNNQFVYSVEASHDLFKIAEYRFLNVSNIKILYGESPHVLQKLLPTVQGSIHFWLDAHFSSGKTYKGQLDSPLMQELEIIMQYFRVFKNCVIFIDDANLIIEVNKLQSGYPRYKDFLDFCRLNELKYKVESNVIILEQETNFISREEVY